MKFMKRITLGQCVLVPVFLITMAPFGYANPNLQANQPPQAIAQSSTFKNSTADLVKARNFARQTIEQKNGGLSRYRADVSMHGPIDRAPFVENEDGTITFKFFGGAPGYKTPTRESVVTVDPKNNWYIYVNYNGPVRR
jgi:hypothetical protein